MKVVSAARALLPGPSCRCSPGKEPTGGRPRQPGWPGSHSASCPGNPAGPAPSILSLQDAAPRACLPCCPPTKAFCPELQPAQGSVSLRPHRPGLCLYCWLRTSGFCLYSLPSTKAWDKALREARLGAQALLSDDMGFPPLPHPQQTSAGQGTSQTALTLLFLPSPALWVQLCKFKCQDLIKVLALLL